jgi:hypothetical protein
VHGGGVTLAVVKPSDLEVRKRVAEFLSKKPGHAFCDDCLARGLGLERATVWAAAGELSPSPDYEIDAGICSVCFTHVEHVAHVEWTTPEEGAGEAETPEDLPKHLIRFKFGA